MTAHDFKVKKIGSSSYWVFNHKKGEICIEPLLFGGFYVGSYDSNLELIEPKAVAETFEEAIQEAHRMIFRT